jgi:quinol monooxygenase YgiN
MPEDSLVASRRAMLAGAAALSLLPWASAARAAEDGKLYVVAELVAKPGQEKTLRDALVAFAPTVPSEPGCISYQLFEDRKRPGRFLTEEIWADEASLMAHLVTPKMKAAAPQLAQILAQPFALTELTRLV